MNQHERVHPIIAVEEHFVTERYWQDVAQLAVGAGEGPEQAFMSYFPKNPVMHSRMADVQTHLAEMDQAGIDVSVNGLLSSTQLLEYAKRPR